MADRRDDLVQTAVIRVMKITGRRSESGEGNQPLSTSYLYRVAYSVLVDEIRRLGRRQETDLDDEAVALAAIAKQSPERMAASREVGRGIQECLLAMKRERRLAVTLHLQGHTVTETARILDWAAKQTENFVYRGLADLRECLMAKGLRP
jgi:RNA polymerase sigma-70 factor (ECF subfamily)